MNKVIFYLVMGVTQIGRKPISVLKNNSCSNSLDEKKWSQIYIFLILFLSLLPWVLGIDYQHWST
jgi:hypothetical protein